MAQDDKMLFSLDLDFKDLESKLSSVEKKIKDRISKIALDIDLNQVGTRSRSFDNITNELNKLGDNFEKISKNSDASNLLGGSLKERNVDELTKALQGLGKSVNKNFPKLEEELSKSKPRASAPHVPSSSGSGLDNLLLLSMLGGKARIPGMSGLGGLANTAGGLMGRLGGIGLMGGLGIAGGLGIGALAMGGMYKSYSQMQSEQGDRLRLRPLLGQTEYERIAGRQGRAYDSRYGFDINQQLRMSGDIARVIGRSQETGSYLRRSMQLNRSFGIDTGMTTQVAGQLFKQGAGFQEFERMMSNAVTAGVDKSKLPVIIPQALSASMALSEQMFSGMGRSTAGENMDLLMRLYSASGQSAMMQPERLGTMLGGMSERIKSVGMGGGDLGTRAFLYRAFSEQSGKPLDQLDFMMRAQEGMGAGGKNIEAVMKQASKEFAGGVPLGDVFKKNKQGDYENRSGVLGVSQLFTQQYGLTVKQTEKLFQAWDKLEKTQLSPEQKSKKADEILKKEMEKNFEKTPEGKLKKSLDDAKNTFSKVGQGLMGTGTKINNVIANLTQALMPISVMLAKLTGQDDLAKELEKSMVTSEKESLAKEGVTAENAYKMLEERGENISDIVEASPHSILGSEFRKGSVAWKRQKLNLSSVLEGNDVDKMKEFLPRIKEKSEKADSYKDKALWSFLAELIGNKVKEGTKEGIKESELKVEENKKDNQLFQNRRPSNVSYSH